MERRVVLGLLVAGLLVGYTPSAEDNQADPHAGHFDHCAKACAECMRECESCAHHCASLVASGHKEHMRTLGTCADCAEFCAAAAKIVSHRGPLVALICESCAKACDTCGEACRKSPDDQHMQACARACQMCAQACRDMLKHIGGAAEEK
jgi:hypothetical protein